MQTGVITSDNLPQVLRDISQKRRQGILEINVNESLVQVYFIQGRIVDVVDSSVHPLVEVVDLLKRAGYLPAEWQFGTDFSGEVYGAGYKELYNYLCEKGGISDRLDQELYLRTIKHKALDRIYRLHFTSGAYYNFKTQMVEVDRDFAASISVGQLLLDLVALDSDHERFDQVFPTSAGVVRTDLGGHSLSEDEELIYPLISKPVRVKELRKETILSVFHFQEALLGLYDRGELQVVQAPAREERKAAAKPQIVTSGDSPTPELAVVDDIVAALEQSIDKEFEAATSELAELQEAAGAEDFHEGNGAKIIPFHRPQEEMEEEFEEDLEEDYGYASPKRFHINLLNMKLLHTSWMPRIVALIFLAGATIIPFLYWRSIFTYFAE